MKHLYSNYKSVLVVAILIIALLPSKAQEIQIDWSTKSIKSMPGSVHKGETLKVSVANVNNIVYDYDVNVGLQLQGGNDDLGLVSKLLGGSAPSSKTGDPCSDAIADATQDISDINAALKDPANKLVPTASHEPIPLSASLAGWDAAIKSSGLLAKLDSDAAKVKASCKGTESDKFFAGPYDKIDKFRKKVEGSHTADGQSVSSQGEVATVTIKIIESYKDSSGTVQTVYVFNTVRNFASVLTLSGGVLMSTLRHPTYTRQSVPGSTDSVLAIDGGAQPVPYIVGLLNYKIPWMDWSKVGFALSTGPVLRVGGGTGTSSFGYFNGLSFHFWHRLYVTGGSHVGQFADTPLGFKVGQTIPSSFTGQLVPGNRWSARVGWAITYKTNDLGTLTQSSGDGKSNPTPKPTPSPSPTASPTPKPSPSPAPTPSPSPTPMSCIFPPARIEPRLDGSNRLLAASLADCKSNNLGRLLVCRTEVRNL